ncbi:hypothetical protein L9F63_026529 [Diploptera punctata]|uniref:Uncharacterized protein n=1 Tax=Diploptera punctata TaxID=6984 RepID=A0AAD8ES21_DIPPU|nr:hypothetical protein L9F63_026529 [Diploptera punctata]
MNNVLVREYRSDLGMAKTVRKSGKNIGMINPTIIERGVKVNAMKLRDIDKLLTTHYGNEWKTFDSLKFYTNLLGTTGNDEGEEAFVEADDNILSV